MAFERDQRTAQVAGLVVREECGQHFCQPNIAVFHAFTY